MLFHVIVTRSGPEWDRSKPLEDEYRVAHAVEAESPEAIRATLANDPWSDSHLVIESIDAWTIRLDGRER